MTTTDARLGGPIWAIGLCVMVPDRPSWGGGRDFHEQKQLLEREISRKERQIALAQHALHSLKQGRDALISSMSSEAPCGHLSQPASSCELPKRERAAL
jgi:hypothetical protein